MVKESFEDLMMGNVSEDVSEDNEKFDERLKQVQAKLAKIAKDEGKSKSYDDVLAQVVRSLSKDLVLFVGFLLDHEIPSLTILGFLSFGNKEAEKAVKEAFSHFLDKPGADFSAASFSDTKVSEQLSIWWTLMIFSDHHSLTVRLQDIKEKQFHETFWDHVKEATKKYFETIEELQYNHSEYEKLVKHYTSMFYTPNDK